MRPAMGAPRGRAQAKSLHFEMFIKDRPSWSLHVTNADMLDDEDVTMLERQLELAIGVARSVAATNAERANALPNAE